MPGWACHQMSSIGLRACRHQTYLGSSIRRSQCRYIFTLAKGSHAVQKRKAEAEVERNAQEVPRSAPACTSQKRSSGEADADLASPSELRQGVQLSSGLWHALSCAVRTARPYIVICTASTALKTRSTMLSSVLGKSGVMVRSMSRKHCQAEVSRSVPSIADIATPVMQMRRQQG